MSKTYEEFLEDVKKLAEERTHTELAFEEHDVEKNGRNMKGICICPASVAKNKQGAYPIFYMKQIYRDIKNASDYEDKLTMLINAIEQALSTSMRTNANDQMYEFLHNKQKVLNEVMFDLIDEALASKEAPKHKVADELLMQPYIHINLSDEMAGRIVVTERLMNEMKISKEELYEHARKNTADANKFEYKVENSGANKMCVLSNHTGKYGSNAILSEEFMKHVSDTEFDGHDLVLVLASNDEVLAGDIEVIAEKANLHKLEASIELMTTTVIPKSDFLSNNVYKYERATGKIEIAR